MDMVTQKKKERLESIISSIKLSDLPVKFKDAPLVNLDVVSLVHPKNILKKFLRTYQKWD